MISLLTLLQQAKARRLELLRDDPYYIMDEPPKPKTPAVDIDSIPVVRLDDLPPLRSSMFVLV